MYIELKHDSQKELTYALRKFNKMIRDSGMMEDLKKKEHYIKKSIRLKLKRADAKRRRIRDEKRLQKRKLNKDI